ncbi:DoxX family protein [Ktedonobacter racemifer]|uniref:DoxX family protein n=1 Tax=Ktedonobacter racemifer DSM 44963 TaxID=485913 RepID=D6TVJ3_KTERA|nr:DoxX family protein [Ktedonobacter racemifer]EFH85396.1 DoxX family protein [Ktedonobacter racemifer DSM 44963]
MNAIISQTNSNPLTPRHVIRSSALWTLQILLALLFVFAGSMKLLTPIEVMKAQMTIPLPNWFVYFTGIAECAGALGLILPGLLRIKRALTPLAACGLLIIMIGATTLTILGGDLLPALFPLVVGLLCVTIAAARRSWTQVA